MMNGERSGKSQLAAENKATKNCQDSLCPGHNLNRHLPNTEHKVCTLANLFSVVQVLIAVANIYCCGSSCFIVLAAAAAEVVVVVVAGGGGGVTYH
jgi:hypothetical protein